MVWTTNSSVILPNIGDDIDELAVLRLPIIGSKVHAIRALCRKYEVDRLEVFGSVTKANFAADSDIDFLVYYPDDYDFGRVAKRYFSFNAELEQLLSRRVDLVMADAIRSQGFADVATASRLLIYVP